MSASLERDRLKLAKEASETNLEKLRVHEQEIREKKAAAERATKRAVFQDALVGIGIVAGTDYRPGVLELALRHFIAHCEAHMGERASERGQPEWIGYPRRAVPAYGQDITFTPGNAARQRRSAQDALFLLCPSDRELAIERDRIEAFAHHKLVTAHTARCTHTDPATGRSTLVPDVFEPTNQNFPARHGRTCTACKVFQPCPASWRSGSIVGVDPDRSEESVGVALVSRNPSGEIIDVVRIENLGERFTTATPLPPPACAHPVVVTGADGARCIDCRRLVGPKPSNSDPAVTPDPGKAPPAD